MSRQHTTKNGKYTYTNHRSYARAVQQAANAPADSIAFVRARFREPGVKYGRGEYEWRTMTGAARRPSEFQEQIENDPNFGEYSLEDIGGSDLSGVKVTGFQTYWASV